MSIDVRVASATNQVDPRPTTRRSPHRTWRWAGGLPFVFVLALVGVGWAGQTTSPAEPETVLAASSAYGPGIGADSLANTQVGGSGCRCTNSETSYRFRATTSSSLTSVRIYLQSGSGYSGGNGGTLSISVQTDSSSHTPSGTVLASTSIRPGNPISIGYLPLVTFGSPARLSAGRLYHLVFRNTDSSPTKNFVSVNALWTRSATSPRQPGLSDLYWAQLRNDGRGWSVQRDFTPILDLGYSNGVHAGMGYMEVWVNTSKTISGSAAVREYIVPKANHTVTSVSVRVSQRSGSSPLTVRLETSGGSVLASGSISAGSIGSSPGWATARLSKAVTLRRGSGYLLVLTAPSGTAYSAFAVERGNHYKFASGTYFTDGYAQYTTGSSWRGFTDGSGDAATNSDLQFIFRATGGSAPPVRRTPRKTAPTPHRTPKPAAAAPATPAPSPSAAPPSQLPAFSVPGPIALVPTPAASQPPVFRALAETAARHPDLGLLLASFAVTVVVLGGLGFALRRRLSL